MARRMVAMGFRVDDEAHRHRRELLDRGHDVARLDRVLPGVDHHDAVLVRIMPLLESKPFPVWT